MHAVPMEFVTQVETETSASIGALSKSNCKYSCTRILGCTLRSHDRRPGVHQMASPDLVRPNGISAPERFHEILVLLHGLAPAGVVDDGDIAAATGAAVQTGVSRAQDFIV